MIRNHFVIAREFNQIYIYLPYRISRYFQKKKSKHGFSIMKINEIISLYCRANENLLQNLKSISLSILNIDKNR